MSLPALTIWEPYATAIALGDKPLENRSWRPERGGLYTGGRFAIHAGRHPVEPAVLKEVARLMGRDPDELECLCRPGHVVAVARLAGCIENPAELPVGHEVWFTGPVAWVLDDVVQLVKPVPCKGAQGVASAAEGGRGGDGATRGEPEGVRPEVTDG